VADSETDTDESVLDKVDQLVEFVRRGLNLRRQPGALAAMALSTSPDMWSGSLHCRRHLWRQSSCQGPFRSPLPSARTPHTAQPRQRPLRIPCSAGITSHAQAG